MDGPRGAPRGWGMTPSTPQAMGFTPWVITQPRAPVPWMPSAAPTPAVLPAASLLVPRGPACLPRSASGLNLRPKEVKEGSGDPRGAGAVQDCPGRSIRGSQSWSQFPPALVAGPQRQCWLFWERLEGQGPSPAPSKTQPGLVWGKWGCAGTSDSFSLAPAPLRRRDGQERSPAVPVGTAS